VLCAGAFGYGASVLVQNAGISRTSVTHAALLIGAVPVLVAIIAAVWERTVARPAAWLGFALSLGGVALVTVGGAGGGATPAGDGLVLLSMVLSAVATVAQGRLLIGCDPVAVTAVEFLGAALGALPVAVITGGAPAAPSGAGPVLAVIALIAGGTLLPFTLFAFGQSHVSAEVAGAFLNIEPLVGAIAGAVAFGDPVGPAQVGGGAAIVVGIGLSSLPLFAGRRPVADAECAGSLELGSEAVIAGKSAVETRDRDLVASALCGRATTSREAAPLRRRAPLPRPLSCAFPRPFSRFPRDWVADERRAGASWSRKDRRRSGARPSQGSRTRPRDRHQKRR
jgi:drug/metabolite transporter (DMT)-like permease